MIIKKLFAALAVVGGVVSATFRAVARHLVSPRFLVQEIGRGMRSHLGTAVAVVLTTTIALAMLGGSLLAATQIGASKGSWYDKTHVGAYFKNAATDSDIGRLERLLEDHPMVEEIWFEDQQLAYENFKAQFATSPDLVDEVDVEHMPRSFRVKLVDPEFGDVVVKDLTDQPGVRKVVDEHAQLSNLFTVLTGFQRTALILAGIQMLATAVLIANMVRATIKARATELEIGRMMGASRTQLSIPLMGEVLIYGLLSAAAGFGALALAKTELIDKRLADSDVASVFVSFIGWDAITDTIPWLLLASVALPLVVTFPTIRKHIQA